jgi:tRNA pseudouridine55 synthase
VTLDVTDRVIRVDKPVGPTSHDVVQAARRALHTRKVGHTGTLDPFASGLLLLCVGAATRLSEYLTGADKSYEAVAELGVTTDTEDREGEVVSRRSGWEALGAADIERAMAAFRGAIGQVPPQYSAKKVDGVAMHRRARRGEQVDLTAVEVTVEDLSLLDWAPPRLRFFVRCSSGTYVRSLARDLGEALSCGAHLTDLRRTRVGSFRVEDAVGVSSLDDPDAVAAASLTPLEALRDMPRCSVAATDVARLAHGQTVRSGDASADGLTAVASDDRLVAIAEVLDGVVRPRKVFVR